MTLSYSELTGDGGSAILEQVVAQRERLAARMASVRQVIAVVSGKGGVGKSALTANLAALLADQGKRVGALDADLNSPALAQMLGVRGQTLHLSSAGVKPAVGMAGVKVMSMDLFLEADETPLVWRRHEGLAEDEYVWRGTMETSAVREFLADTRWGELDMLLIDLPPGVERYTSLTRLMPALTGLAVTIPSRVSYMVVRKSIQAIQQAGGELFGLVENMTGYVCPSCREVGPLFPHRSDEEQLATMLGIPLLGSIPFDPRLTQACDEGLPFVLSHSGDPTATALQKIVVKLFSTPEA